MGMAGPSGHEWLAAVLHNVKVNDDGSVTLDLDEWGNMVGLARRELNIPDDATDDGDVLAQGLMFRPSYRWRPK